MKDPMLPEEWRRAVDAAHVLLTIHAARQYGLVEGGPEIDVHRCAEILDGGAKLGFVPSPNAIEEALQAAQPSGTEA